MKRAKQPNETLEAAPASPEAKPMFFHTNPNNFYGRWGDYEFGMENGEPVTPGAWKKPEEQILWFRMQLRFLRSMEERMETYLTAIIAKEEEAHVKL